MKRKDVQILIIDDDPSMSSSLAEYIRRLGYKVSAVGSVDEASSFVKIKQVHLIVLDCMLPKINGIQFANRLRSSRFGSGPIILISGIFKDKTFIVDAIKQTGAVGFLLKPLNLKDLRDLMEESLKEIVDNRDVSLSSLVSKHHLSAREQLKVVENVSEISGKDMPFIVSVMMFSEFTGHINIIS
ncbi:MAG: response regulator, partial [Bdellovibrionales bacterium]|nr:response regulator [Bdellovibrionales bacterium]